MRKDVRRDGTEGYLRDDMETHFTENFEKYINTIIMKSSNNGEDEISFSHLLSPNKTSSIA